MDNVFTSYANCNPAEYVVTAEQNTDFDKPVSRRKLGKLLKMDDRVLKSYESYGIITGVKSPGYKNTRYVPRLVLEQIAEHVRNEHASTQHLFNTAKEKMKYGKKTTA